VVESDNELPTRLYSKRRSLLIVVWVAAFLWIFATSGGSGSLRQDYELANQGHRTLATVTALELSNHGGCRYVYRVSPPGTGVQQLSGSFVIAG
jgi:hypothetical protein